MWNRRSCPSRRPTATIEPSARNPYDDRPKTHAGSANSASIGARGSRRGPSTRRYRFHQPLRSETRWRIPSALHSGCATDSSGPPAARSGSPSEPSAAIAATRRRVASHGMLGWSHSSQARRSPAGEIRGAATKSGPGHEDARLTLPVHRDVDDLVAWLALARVVLADRDEPPPGGIEAQVGVPPRTGRRDRAPARRRPGRAGTAARRRSRSTTTTPPATVYDPPPYSWTRVRTETDSGTTASAALGAEAHEDLAAAFGRPGLQPVQVVAVDPGLVQADLVGDQVLDPDRTPPGPVRGDGGFGHRPVQVPCCQDET